MPKENPNNIIVTCSQHSSKPDPKLHKWPPSYYIGCAVKITFSNEEKDREHMWVIVTGAVDEPNQSTQLVGTLDNDPVLDVGYQCGDKVVFEITAIEDLLR